MKITVNDLRIMAKDYEQQLNDEGYNVKIKCCNGCGMFAYLFIFTNPKDTTQTRQIDTHYCTKEECYYKLTECFNEALYNYEYYTFKSDCCY